MTPDVVAALIGILTPLVVWGVTALVKKYFPIITGWGIVAILVPILALAVTWITDLVTTSSPHWYFQIILGLLAVFIQEVYKQVKQGFETPKPPTP